MSTDVDDIAEFNERVAGASGNALALQPTLSSRNYPDDSVECESEANNKLGNVEMWARYGDAYKPCETAVNELPPGQYVVENNHSLGIHFRKKEVSLDDLLVLPDSSSKEIIESLDEFWEKEKHFRRFGFLWKRGVLLWGPAGSGKTSTVQIISKKIIDTGGITVYVTHPGLGAQGLELLRKVEPTRPIVVLLEDIDAITEQYGESSLLALLDGELQIDNVVFLATTNYPERLDKRLVNRPSRFDIVKKIGMPTAKARKVYLLHKNPRLDHPGRSTELQRWVEETKGFSVAHLKELIVSVEVFEIPFDVAIKRLRAMMDVKISSDQAEDSNFGFINND